MPHQIIRTLAVDGWAVTFDTARKGPGPSAAQPSPLIAVPNDIWYSVTAHPSTASVPITVLLYDGPLLCGFNVAIKGLKDCTLTKPYPRLLPVCLSVITTASVMSPNGSK